MLSFSHYLDYFLSDKFQKSLQCLQLIEISVPVSCKVNFFKSYLQDLRLICFVTIQSRKIYFKHLTNVKSQSRLSHSISIFVRLQKLQSYKSYTCFIFFPNRTYLCWHHDAAPIHHQETE